MLTMTSQGAVDFTISFVATVCSALVMYGSHNHLSAEALTTTSNPFVIGCHQTSSIRAGYLFVYPLNDGLASNKAKGLAGEENVWRHILQE